MTTNDELARLRTAFAAPAMPAIRTTPEPEACPPPDRIWLAVRGELPPDELREIVDHIAACTACAEDWRIAMAFEEEARTAIPAVPGRTRTAAGSMRYRAWMAVAATILVAVVGLQFHKPKPHYRSGEGKAVESLLERDASIPRQRFVLSWTSVPEAASYDITVQSVTLTPMHEAKGVAATSYTVPESALAGLRSGTKLSWTVTPVSRDGGRLRPLTSTLYVIDQPQ